MTNIQRTARHGPTPAGNLQGHSHPLPSKWQLLNAVERCRAPLGLKSTSLAILRSMLTFMPTDTIHDAEESTHICFASNAALAERAHVSIQTVERHVSKLVALGLLTRRSSGNGKRWARRDRSGVIVLATGLSLMPLANRHHEFLATADAQDATQRKLINLRDHCVIALARLTSLCAETPNIELLVEQAKRLLRRKPDAEALTDLLSKLTQEIEERDTSKPPKLRDTTPKNEGHKEPNKNPNVQKTDTNVQVSHDEMQHAYPKLCAELRFASSQSECAQRMDTLAATIGISRIWPKVRQSGPALSFMILGYLLEKAETLHQPAAYARYLLNGISKGTIDWRSLLKDRRQIQPMAA